MSKKRLKDFSVTIPFKSQKVEAKTMYPKLGREDCIPNNGCKVASHNCPTPRKGGELAPARPAGGPKGPSHCITGKSLKGWNPSSPFVGKQRLKKCTALPKAISNPGGSKGEAWLVKRLTTIPAEGQRRRLKRRTRRPELPVQTTDPAAK